MQINLELIEMENVGESEENFYNKDFGCKVFIMLEILANTVMPRSL